MNIVENEVLEAIDKFLDSHDGYPHHFIMHLIHSAEIIGYKHPNQKIKKVWLAFYRKCCDSMHMRPETEKQMDKRLRDEV